MSHNSEIEFDIKEIKHSLADQHEDLKGLQRKKKKRSFFRLGNVLLVIIVAALLAGGYLFYQTSSAFDMMTGQSNSLIKSIAKMIPLSDNIFQILPQENSQGSAADQFKNDKLDRLNILLLGYRGVDDPNGGLLTDSMMVISIKKNTGEVALISIPRDLYVTLPHSESKGKINEAYALGMKNNGWKGALSYSKQEITEITGLDIHYVASIDFSAFKEIIDALGGITIHLDQPFVEKVPFAEGPISLPAGFSTISGEKALLYSRARESSSDFDRVRRQQQVLLAIKEKALSLGVISNPAKIVSIISSLGNHVRTDAELWEIEDIAGMLSKADSSKIRHKVFDTTEAGLLFQSHSSDGAYILLPEGGSYEKIQETCKNIFDVQTAVKNNQ